ncbi:Hypothetical predicted protein, partial [Paramuricea clavata]
IETRKKIRCYPKILVSARWRKFWRKFKHRWRIFLQPQRPRQHHSKLFTKTFSSKKTLAKRR